MLLRRFILLCTIMATAIARKEGDPCTNHGQSGVCQLQSSCAEYPRMERLGARPMICGYKGKDGERIICCPTLNPVLNLVSRLGLRKSEQYCEKWREIALRDKIVVPASLDPGVERKILVPNCDVIEPSIRNGNETRNGEFPHMAALGWFNEETSRYDFMCGGSLISDRYVLTAAHCVYGSGGLKEPDIVRLGDNDLHSTDDGQLGSDFEVQRVIRYPNYRPSKGKHNDIALIELNQTVEFDSTIRPACLWTSAELNMATAIATGYGTNDTAREPLGKLLKIELDIIEYETCSMSFLSNLFRPSSVVETQLCALDPETGKDTCQGDSGGPLQVTLEGHQCLFYIIGITAYGPYCGGNTPGVYTKVSAYLDWIESEVWPN